jgi:hypothetical protein
MFQASSILGEGVFFQRLDALELTPPLFQRGKSALISGGG